MMNIDIDTTPYRASVTEFLSGKTSNTQLSIPPYQRNYTWTVKDQVNPLLDDFSSLLEGKFDKHFIGIVIYNVSSMSGFKGNEFSIIDGQQRISTLVLFFMAFRDVLLEQKKVEEATLIENTYLINSNIAGDRRMKLRPRLADNDALLKIANKELGKLSEEEKNSNVYKNYLRMKEWIISKEQQYTDDDILQAIGKVYVVAVPVNGETDYPQKIFESINSTGAELSDADLIKNFLFMGLTAETQEVFYSKYWREIEHKLDSQNSSVLQNYFRIYLEAKSYKQISPANYGVYRAFKARTLSSLGYEGVNDKEKIETLLKELVEYVSIYAFIYKEKTDSYYTIGQGGKKKLERAYLKPLIDFRTTGTASEMPAAFLVQMFYLNSKTDSQGKQIISDDSLAQIIQVTDNYLNRRALANLDTSDVTRIFTPLLGGVLSDAEKLGYENIVNIYKKRLINDNSGTGAYCPDEDDLAQKIRLNNKMYGLAATRRLLDRIETTDNKTGIDISTLSIEHIMPETVTNQWLEYLGCTTQQYNDYLHRLGNLTLASKPDNSALGNKPYEYKQQLLKGVDELQINKPIKAEKEWKFKQIDERTDRLIKKANELYPYQADPNIAAHRIDAYLTIPGRIDAIAQLDEDNKTFYVLTGTTFAKPINGMKSKHMAAVLKDLLDHNFIQDQGNAYVFNNDYIFYPEDKDSSIDVATELLLNEVNEVDPWVLWQTKNGDNTFIALRKHYELTDHFQDEMERDQLCVLAHDINEELTNTVFVPKDDDTRVFDFTDFGTVGYPFINMSKPEEGVRIGIYFKDKKDGYDFLRSKLNEIKVPEFQYAPNSRNAGYIACYIPMDTGMSDAEYKGFAKKLVDEIVRLKTFTDQLENNRLIAKPSTTYGI